MTTTPDGDATIDTQQPEAAAGVELPPRSSWQLLRDRTFGPFFAGRLIATIGVWVSNVAGAIVVWDLTRSSLLVGAVSVGQFTPQMLLTPLSGARADSGSRYRQLIAGRVITASGSLGLALWIAIVGLSGTPGAWAVIAAATVIGIGFAIGGPAMHSLVPSLVRPNELARAIALNSIPFTAARAIGPAIGAIALATVGAIASFAMAGLSNLAFAAIIWRLPRSGTKRARPVDSRVRAGWAYVRSSRSMSALLIGVVTIGVGTDPVITLTPAVASGLGATSALVGVLASAFGIGAGLALPTLNWASARWGIPRLAPAGLALMALGLVVVAAAATPWLAVAGMAIGGFGLTYSLTSLTTLIQEEVPEELRGRVMSLWAVAFLGSRPISAAISGVLADWASTTIALLFGATVLVVGAFISRPARTRPQLVGQGGGSDDR